MIEVSHLTKYYGDVAALEDLTFKLVPGEILGFLGPNGAGKSTAMKMLTGFLRPSSGEVRIWGSNTLSKGFKRRVGLAQAILHDPDVLILDEPTDGLDPNQKHQVRKMIKGLSADKIVIVSTHNLEEVTAVCNRAMVLAKGRVVSDGTPESLMAMSPYHGAVTLKSSSASLAEIAEVVGSITGVKEAVPIAGGITIFPENIDNTLFTKVLEVSLARGWKVDSLYVESGRLDDVFRSLTEGESQ